MPLETDAEDDALIDEGMVGFATDCESTDIEALCSLAPMYHAASISQASLGPLPLEEPVYAALKKLTYGLKPLSRIPKMFWSLTGTSWDAWSPFDGLYSSDKFATS